MLCTSFHQAPCIYYMSHDIADRYYRFKNIQISILNKLNQNRISYRILCNARIFHQRQKIQLYILCSYFPRYHIVGIDHQCYNLNIWNPLNKSHHGKISSIYHHQIPYMSYIYHDINSIYFQIANNLLYILDSQNYRRKYRRDNFVYIIRNLVQKFHLRKIPVSIQYINSYHRVLYNRCMNRHIYK